MYVYLLSSIFGSWNEIEWSNFVLFNKEMLMSLYGMFMNEKGDKVD